MTRRQPPILALTALGLCWPAVSSGQTISGIVREAEGGGPIANATVMVVGRRDSVRAISLSGPDGAFQLTTSAGDTVRVRVERLGYRPMASQLLVLAEASHLSLDVQLHASPIALAPLTVTAERWTRNRAAFERRRRGEIWGRFAGPDRVSAIRSPRAADRLRPFVPGMAIGPDGIVRVPKRGADLSGVPSCQPRFVIDGIRYPGDISLDALLTGASMRAVEYYREPQWAPAEFSMGYDPMLVVGMNADAMPVAEYGLAKPCAIIVIWTERSFGPDQATPSPPE